MYRNKKNIYRKVMTHNVTQVYKQINKLLQSIPANTDIKMNEDGKHQETILNVLSIEEEWIIDDDLREDLSLVQFKK
tara:strand:- start:678 stop:908 length:231 start_codon:yes stop_codon:yes gene_type:complete